MERFTDREYDHTFTPRWRLVNDMPFRLLQHSTWATTLRTRDSAQLTPAVQSFFCSTDCFVRHQIGSPTCRIKVSVSFLPMPDSTSGWEIWEATLTPGTSNLGWLLYACAVVPEDFDENIHQPASRQPPNLQIWDECQQRDLDDLNHNNEVIVHLVQEMVKNKCSWAEPNPKTNLLVEWK